MPDATKWARLILFEGVVACAGTGLPLSLVWSMPNHALARSLPKIASDCLTAIFFTIANAFMTMLLRVCARRSLGILSGGKLEGVSRLASGLLDIFLGAFFIGGGFAVSQLATPKREKDPGLGFELAIFLIAFFFYGFMTPLLRTALLNAQYTVQNARVAVQATVTLPPAVAGEDPQMFYADHTQGIHARESDRLYNSLALADGLRSMVRWRDLLRWSLPNLAAFSVFPTVVAQLMKQWTTRYQHDHDALFQILILVVIFMIVNFFQECGFLLSECLLGREPAVEFNQLAVESPEQELGEIN